MRTKVDDVGTQKCVKSGKRVLNTILFTFVTVLIAEDERDYKSWKMYLMLVFAKNKS